MSSYWKTTRLVLIFIAVIAGGCWTSVTFLGENWSEQGRYLLTLLSMLLLILLSAALLLGVLKTAALLWEKLVSRTAVNDEKTRNHNDNGQE